VGFFQYIVQDWENNRNNTKGKVVTMLFRIASFVSASRVRRICFAPYLIFYRFFVEWIMGIELPWRVKIDRGLQLHHGHALVINKNVKLGKNCVVRQSTTIGNAKAGGDCPIIGDNVDIGSNVCILGPIRIGNNVIIGAGSVVVKSIPSNSIAVGNPARVIKELTLGE
jgi:putative colanic acid biosynthesis acetyltransferase WcaB